ncbi:uncharacterized protein LOC116019307 [Ipomoea triloba]|uniref:uncharacterized protein LOC116019307 n=1 Tax=Ipomoea triloba TaxID=35885 RepID=UPI00125D4E0E|nr:uncharacterized protein LOC116019307 [Ipomoea triloba]
MHKNQSSRRLLPLPLSAGRPPIARRHHRATADTTAPVAFCRTSTDLSPDAQAIIEPADRIRHRHQPFYRRAVRSLTVAAGLAGTQRRRRAAAARGLHPPSPPDSQERIGDIGPFIAGVPISSSTRTFGGPMTIPGRRSKAEIGQNRSDLTT